MIQEQQEEYYTPTICKRVIMFQNDVKKDHESQCAKSRALSKVVETTINIV